MNARHESGVTTRNAQPAKMSRLKACLKALKPTIVLQRIYAFIKSAPFARKKDSMDVKSDGEEIQGVTTAEIKPDTPLSTTDKDKRPQVCCAACATEFDYNSASVIRPCPQCTASYCSECMNTMFTAAITDPVRMPPRCCQFLQLYKAIDLLTDDEILQYRHKFEEWITLDKTYCPKPACSAFVSPLRIATARAALNGGNAAVDCLSCHTAICVDCKEVSHDGVCDNKKAEQEAAMLTRYGYKQCPNCHHAIKKMYGCDHMLCLCGGHFCWSCVQPIHMCGGCGESDDEEEDEDDGYLEESSNCNENDTKLPETLTQQSSTTIPNGEQIDELTMLPDKSRPDSGYGIATVSPDENEPYTEVSPTIDGADACVGTPSGTLPAVTTTLAAPSPSASETPTVTAERIVNLDAGGRARWEDDCNVNFGNEPTEHQYALVWECQHRFDVFERPVDGLNHGNFDRMECNRCFTKVVSPTSLAAGDKVLDSDSKAECANNKQHVVVQEDSAPASLEDESMKCMQAWQCDDCSIMVCGSCRPIFSADRGSKAAVSDSRPTAWI